MGGGHHVGALLLAGKPVQGDAVPVGGERGLPAGIADRLRAVAPDGQVRPRDWWARMLRCRVFVAEVGSPMTLSEPSGVVDRSGMIAR